MAVQKAYYDFSLAFDRWKTTLVDIEMLETGLELCSLLPNMGNQIRDDLMSVSKHFLDKNESGSFPDFSAKLKGARHTDSWTPSKRVFQEYCARIRTAFRKYKKAVEHMNLRQLQSDWLASIKKEENDI